MDQINPAFFDLKPKSEQKTNVVGTTTIENNGGDAALFQLLMKPPGPQESHNRMIFALIQIVDDIQKHHLRSSRSSGFNYV